MIGANQLSILQTLKSQFSKKIFMNMYEEVKDCHPYSTHSLSEKFILI